MKVRKEQFTYRKFLELYPDDKACLDKFFKTRYSSETQCSKCEKPFSYSLIQCGKYYQCAWCAHKISPLANTIFHKSSTKLQTWFLAIFLFAHSKNGVSAKEFQRLTGVTYKTAWRICKQIRNLFKDVPIDMLNGIVEIDETYFGGKEANKHQNKKTARTQGRSVKTKTPILGAIEREGNMVAKVVSNTKSSTVKPFLSECIAITAEIKTDEYKSYVSLSMMGYSHDTVDHGRKGYVRGNAHTNNIEGFWSQLKRSINGTYHNVSPKYLQSYVDEFSYRYNHRNDSLALFPQMLLRALRRVQ